MITKEVGIYRIICMENLKTYFGSTNDFSVRKKAHIQELNRGVHVNNILQHAWDKYGKDAFVFQFVEHVEPDYLLEREQVYLDFLFANGRNCRFNVNPYADRPPGVRMCGKDNPMFGKNFSQDHRKKISMAGKGMPHPWASESAKRSNRNRVVGKGYFYREKSRTWEVNLRGTYYGRFKSESEAALLVKQVREQFKKENL